MAIEAEDFGALLALLLIFLRWLFHASFATGLIILSIWLQHIRDHEFDQQHRKIDRRYCLMAIVFYALAAAFHLGNALMIISDACGAIILSWQKKKNQSTSPGLRRESSSGKPSRLCIGLVLDVIPHIVLLFPYIRWLRRFEANDEGRNAAYTIACIVVSALNITLAALYLCGGFGSIVGLLLWSWIEARRESIRAAQQVGYAGAEVEI
ncbi:hypothetical protein TgHK011_008686 [Trichoderma gracile]|nr:hypothetical protein TgHK011_008686 [Trichoderma gracile]